MAPPEVQQMINLHLNESELNEVLRSGNLIFCDTDSCDSSAFGSEYSVVNNIAQHVDITGTSETDQTLILESIKARHFLYHQLKLRLDLSMDQRERIWWNKSNNA